MLVAILVEQHYTWERYSKRSRHWSEFSGSYPLLNILSQLLAFWSIWLSLLVLSCYKPLSTFVWTGSNFIFWSCHPSLSIPFEVGLLLHVVFLSVRMQSKCLTLTPNTNYHLLSDTCHSHCQRRGKFCSQFCWFEAPVVLVYLQSISLLWVV